MSFNDKVVIVTGASSGIGAAIAVAFSELGAKVTVVGRNKNKLNEVARKCKDPLVLVADVTKENDLKKIVNDTVKHFGKLDILINNAGTGQSTSILNDNAMSVFDLVMATNLRSSVYLTHLAAPHIIKTKGNIINISSITAMRIIFKETFAYNSSKAALDHFTRSIAAELASSGVRVNSVNPGPVKTDIVKNVGVDEAHQKAAYDKMLQMTAFGRVSEPEEIADLVLFLASDKAKAITGASFVSDNGLMIKVE